MHLSALELAGFKSFAKPTQLTFEPGLTCVVGPNGSGKSAVADGIRWVLGEQSLKSIRAKRSDDVIFAGSRSRSRLGQAEVSLTLAETDAAGLDTPELVITRRIDRSGQSDYLVNGRPVRLFDLAELLARVGFAQKSYTVIPQGMIDTLVTASPQERRQMFEDATGVTPLLLKKDRTERKLAETRQQILRAHDLLRELEPRLRMLKRQAARARSRAEVETTLRSAEERYAALRWVGLTEQLTLSRSAQEAADVALAEHRAALKALRRPAVDIAADARALPALQKTIEDLRTQEREMLISVTRAEVTGSEGVDRLAEELVARMKERTKLAHEAAALQARATESEQRAQASAVALSSAAGRLLGSGASPALAAEARRALAELRERLAIFLEHVQDVRGPQDLPALRAEGEALALAIADVESFLGTEGRGDERPGTLAPHAPLKDLAREHLRVQGDLRTIEVRLATLRERLRTVEERIDTLHRQQTALTPTAGPTENLASLQTRLLETRNTIKAQEVELQKLQGALVRAHATSAEGEAEEQRLQNLLWISEEERTTALTHIAEATARRDDLLREAREHLGDDCALRLERGQVHTDQKADLDALRHDIEQLRRKLLEIGGIDTSVLDEEAVVEQRVTELKTNVTDLEGAEKSLRAAMKELEQHIHERFAAAFHAMSESFNHHFREVFGGGRASLSLVKPQPVEHVLPDVADEAEGKELRASADGEPGSHVHELPAGIEIHAHPPGKKVSSLAQLSGGEKALVSLALLFAILQERASPFVVLDEVDAALDESNSRRFALLLKTMAERTQCIVITHNRATMEAARALYGVTMGEDGVSQLLSVKLEDVSVGAAAGHAPAASGR